MIKAGIGICGLTVMGQNPALDMESKGFTVTVFNRTAQKTKDFIEDRAKAKNGFQKVRTTG